MRHNYWIAWMAEQNGVFYYSRVHRARTDRTGSGCPRSSKRVYLKVGVCALCHNWNAVSVSGLSLKLLKLEFTSLRLSGLIVEKNGLCSIESLLCGMLAGLKRSRTMKNIRNYWSSRCLVPSTHCLSTHQVMSVAFSGPSWVLPLLCNGSSLVLMIYSVLTQAKMVQASLYDWFCGGRII